MPHPLLHSTAIGLRSLLLLALLASQFVGCGGSGSSGTAPPFGLSSRALVDSLNFPLGVPVPGEIEFVEVFTDLSFSSPVFLTHAPDGTDRIFVVEKAGEIHVFGNDPDATDSTVFLDLDVRSSSEQGLLGLAFAPDYEDSGYFYVYYMPATGSRRSVISRFEVSSSDPDVADADSELVLLEVTQPYSNHNGGMIAFGPDGYLYIALGDGGSAGDPGNHGQDKTTLLGAVLRIDPTETGYDIPGDNPLVGDGGGVKEEIYAWGLRNPWRFSFDRETGDLWLADVGQNTREEIDRVENGDNLGWRIYEGTEEYNNPLSLPASDFVDPIYSYPHSVGWSITGGYVYRGSEIASLEGAYVYGDYGSDRIWSLVVINDTVVSNTELGTVTDVASFGEDEAGELYVVSIGGSIFRIEEGEAPPPEVEDPPELLSETGIFTDLPTLEPSAGVIPYGVNFPEWADDATLRRWVFVPGSTQIDFAETGAWQFPVGTVLVKHFDMTLNADETRRLETRVLVHGVGGWQSHLYRWRTDESDADLLTDGTTEVLTITDPDAPGGTRTQTWTYPSTAQCSGCHTAAAGHVLGIRTRQLNGTFEYGSITDNQLRAWNNIRLFKTTLAAPSTYEAFPIWGDDDQDPPALARAFLDVNCSMCHQPKGPAPTDMDLRFDTATDAMQVVDVTPSAGDLDLIDPAVVRPGDPESSVLWERLQRLDENRMPPLQGHVDAYGVDLIDDWINSIPAD